MKNEKWLSRKLRDEHCPDLFIESFEWSMVPNTLDLYCVSRHTRRSCWVELKVVNTRAQKIPFRKGQVPWMARHMEAGGSSMLLVYIDKENRFLLAPDAVVVNAGERCNASKLLEARRTMFLQNLHEVACALLQAGN
jgi:hypothetical protein